MKNNKTLTDVFKKQAVVMKLGFEAANTLWADRKRETVGGTIVDVVEDAGTRNMTIMLEAGEDIDFAAGGGMGLPAPIDKTESDKIIKALKLKGKEERELAREILQPSAPYPGVLLTAPDETLLRLLDKKMAGVTDPELAENATYLKYALEDKTQIKKLQATYNVGEILEKFPDCITVEELATAQGPAHGNKTYSLIDFGKMQDENGQPRQYITISVLPEAGLHVQDMFGEAQKNVLHLGDTSTHLYNLNVGDDLRINRDPKNKDDFQMPKDLSKGSVFIGQGNGAVPFVSMLKDLQQKKDAGENVAPVHLILAAKDEESIWGLKYLEPYLEDGTIGTLDIALSRTDKTLGQDNSPNTLFEDDMSDQARARATVYHGTRLADDVQGFDDVHEGLFEPKIENSIHTVLKNGGDVYVSSGRAFQITMRKAVAEIAARHDVDLDGYKGRLRISKSPSRIQGETKGWSTRLAGANLMSYLNAKK